MMKINKSNMSQNLKKEELKQFNFTDVYTVLI